MIRCKAASQRHPASCLRHNNVIICKLCYHMLFYSLGRTICSIRICLPLLGKVIARALGVFQRAIPTLRVARGAGWPAFQCCTSSRAFALLACTSRGGETLFRSSMLNGFRSHQKPHSASSLTPSTTTPSPKPSNKREGGGGHHHNDACSSSWLEREIIVAQMHIHVHLH